MTTYYYSDNPNKHPTFSLRGVKFSIDRPCVTVMAAGMGGDSLGHWHLADDGLPDPRRDRDMDQATPKQPTAPRRGVPQLFDRGKPPYRVPLVEEVREIPWNGLTVASLFAGGGGSSMGYRMAGYKVVWANEFVPSAHAVYRANMGEGTVLDTRDVRDVTAEDILKATGLKRGALSCLDGSPPCQAFSTAGLRERGWGKDREYEHGARQKNEDMFWEYIRLRDGLQPQTFVAENVSGLVKGAAKGYFLEILRLLKRGYRVQSKLLDAQWLGVPQARQRIFFVGVREDLGLEPAFPMPLAYRYSVRDAIPWIGRALHDTQGQPQYSAGDITHRPSPTVMPGEGGRNNVHFQAEDARVVHDMGGRGKWNMSKGDVTDQPSPPITNGSHPGANATHFKITVGRGSRRRRENGKPYEDDAPLPAVLADGGRKNSAQFMVTHETGRRGQAARDITDEPAPTITAGPQTAAEGGGPRNHFKVTQPDRYGHERDVTDEPALTIRATDGSKGAKKGPKVIARTKFGKNAQYRDVTDEPSTAVRATGGRRAAEDLCIVGNTNAAHGRKGERYDARDPSPTIMARRSNVEVRRISQHDEVDENTAATLEGYCLGSEYDRMNPGDKSTKYFSMVKPRLGDPCPTVTAQGVGGDSSGGAGSTASVVHPTEKRKFTILELKRICGFPDDMFMTGSYGSQWQVCGNAVPPPMARAVAEAIRDKILLPWREKCAAPLKNDSGRKSKKENRTSAGRGKLQKLGADTVTSGTAMTEASSSPTSSRSRKGSAADSGPASAGSTHATIGRAATQRTFSRGRKKRTSPT